MKVNWRNDQAGLPVVGTDDRVWDGLCPSADESVVAAALAHRRGVDLVEFDRASASSPRLRSPAHRKATLTPAGPTVSVLISLTDNPGPPSPPPQDHTSAAAPTISTTPRGKNFGIMDLTSEPSVDPVTHRD